MKHFPIISALLVFTFIGDCFGNPNADLYGKPCSNESYSEGHHGICSLDKNMYCSERGICECIIGERGRLFAHHDRTCIEVSSTENLFACTEDIQCTLSKYGRYSRCNRDYDRCECFSDTETAVLVNNVCFIQHAPRALRSAQGFQGCSDSSDCKATSLGELSRCNEADSSCECYDSRTSGKKEVVYYNGTCVYKKSLHEFCNNDDECRAGFHKNAYCGSHPSYLPKEMVCQCPEDKRCDDGNGARGEAQSFVTIFLSTLLMGMVAKVLG